MSNKNDAADAEAICEAVQRPSMRFVPAKSIEQEELQSLHRIRSQVVARRRGVEVHATTVRRWLRRLEYGCGVVETIGVKTITSP